MDRPSSSHRSDLDAAKGVLISIIVLGHNYYFSRYFVLWFALFYNFHVACFLLYPFLFRYNRMDRAAYLSRMFRTLAPQVAFLVVVIPVYYAMFVAGRSEGAGEWLGRLPLALLLQTETQLKAVTGFRHFWFLPAMAVSILLLWLVDNARARVVGVLVAALALWHLYAGEIDDAVLQYYPWGIVIVGFLFVPGLIVRHLRTWTEARFRKIPASVDILLLVIWLALAWLVFRYRLFMPLAGDPYSLVSGIKQPGRLLFQDLFLLVSMFTVLRAGWWLRRTLLAPIGRESLKIFLLSPLVWQVFWMAGGQSLEARTNLGKTALVILSFAGTMAVTYGLASLIAATPLQRLVFPKCPADWRKLWRAGV